MGCTSSDEEFLSEYKSRFSAVNASRKQDYNEQVRVDFQPELLDKDLAIYANDSPEYYNTPPDIVAFNQPYHTPSPSRNRMKKGTSLK